jgi:SAM-dependent methyltransferase
MSSETVNPERIDELLDAVYPSFALLAGMELNLFSLLGTGAMPLSEIATALNVKPRKIGPLLYSLVVAGMLRENSGQFSNAPDAQRFLVEGQPGFLGGMHELISSNWKRILDTASTIRNGSPLAKYDYHSGQDELTAVLRGLYPGTVSDAALMMKRFDFSDTRTLLDVGGGSGGLAISFVQALPDLQAAVLDLPSITPITRQFISEAGLEDKIKVAAADAVTEPVKGSYDVVLARHLFQVLSAEDNRNLMRNIAHGVRPGGRLFIKGWILDDSRMAPEKTVGFNLILLNGYAEGQAYTESEYRHWIEEAGLEAAQRTELPNGDSIITAHKPN